MAVAKRRETIGVMVGNVQVGGAHRSWFNYDHYRHGGCGSTAKQVMELVARVRLIW